MRVVISVGKDEIGASALRRYFSAWMDSSNDLISASMACCWYSQEFASLGSITASITVFTRTAITYPKMKTHNHLSGRLVSGFAGFLGVSFLWLPSSHPPAKIKLRFRPKKHRPFWLFRLFLVVSSSFTQVLSGLSQKP